MEAVGVLLVDPDAGSGSFRRKARLVECLEAAQARVEWLAQEREHPDPGVSRRERAAQERLARVEEALRQLPEVQARSRSVRSSTRGRNGQRR